MTKKKLKRRIKELERRVAELEQRIQFTHPYVTPGYGHLEIKPTWQPFWNGTGDPMPQPAKTWCNTPLNIEPPNFIITRMLGV